MPVTKTVKTLVAEAKEQTDSINPADAHDRQQAGDAILIDIRDIRELQRDGHIEGAFHAPRGMLEFWADPNSPYHKEIFAPAVGGRHLLPKPCKIWDSAISVIWKVALPHGKQRACPSPKTINDEQLNRLLPRQFRKI
jgi:rhodanese-related sulfurtransferase